MPNLRQPQPGRKEITRENVVLQDIIDCLANKIRHDVNSHLARFEEEATSRFGMVLNHQLDVMVERIRLFQGRIDDIRYEMNNGKKRGS